MTWQLGDVVPLSVTVRDADDQPADAGAVSVTITLPDGTTDINGDITPTTTGVYDHNYATTQAGRHAVRWIATGANASAFTDAFDVEPADDGDFISLADAKRHLVKTDTDDDAELAGFVSAACRMIVDRVGPVSPTSMTETVRVGHWRENTIILGTSPVINVTSVTVRGTDPTTIPAADPDAGTSGWTLDKGAGVLTHTRRWPYGTIQVEYRAGRAVVPGNIRLAALELVSHMWRTMKLNASGGRPALSGADEVVMVGSAYALPFRVRELLGLGKLPTGDILVG